MRTAAEVLAFWFGEPPATEARGEWFRKDETFDALIRTRFGATIEAALAGGLQDWDATPAGTLARIVVLDQFTRNSFRDTPRAFAGDAWALGAAQALVERGGDQQLPTLQRWFAYMPFEHSESPDAQRTSLRLFAALAAADPALAEAQRYAHKHAEVIERFGRYPHRNAVLGRVSTPDEEVFLREPGSRF
jgi:uncharacterized protein (DUF924 family)